MAEVAREKVHNAAGSGAYVLVVDNDARNLVLMAMVLQRLEYRVCTANYADKAVEMAHYTPPSLIITDLNLRGMTGFEMMQRIRQEPRNAAVPVILISRELTPEIERQCREAGSSVCLPQPVQADALYQAINPLIEPRSRRADIRIQTRIPVTMSDRPLDDRDGEYATNLSVNGMHIRTRRSCIVDSTVQVKMTLHGEIVSAEARVVHCYAAGEGPSGIPGVGLKFLKTSAQAKELIRKFINDEVTHGLAPGPT